MNTFRIMRICMCGGFLIMHSGTNAATTYNQTVNGIRWTYTISNGVASVGGDISSLTAVPTSTTGAIAIPSKLGGYPVRSVGKYAFYSCSGLTSVTIPDGVTSIGYYAFSGCSRLVSFSVGSGNANYKSVNGQLLSKDGETLVAGVNGNVTIPNSVTSVKSYAFYGCSGLTSVTIPDSVTSIGSFAFSGCSGLTSVTIPNSVTSIGYSAFSDCNGLTSVTIPDSVEEIGGAAFAGCNSSLYESTQMYGVLVVDGWVVGTRGKGSYSASQLNFEGIRGIADSVFYRYGYDDNITSVDMGSTIEHIGDNVFDMRQSLTTIVFPATLKTIGISSDCVPDRDIYILGDAPRLTGVAQMYDSVVISSATFRLHVRRGSKGWNVEIPGVWKNCNIDYIPEYSITINGNGLDVIREKTVYDINGQAKIGELPNWSRNGYRLIGWYTNKDGSLEVDANTVVVRDTTIYAHWVMVNEVAFDANGGIGGWRKNMDCGSEIVVPKVTRDGYRFTGWIPDVDATVPESNVTYTAQWEINRYVVTFDANGGEGGEVAVRDHGASLAAPVVTRMDHDFLGWFMEASGGERITEEDYVVTHDATLYAHWKLKSGAWRYSLDDGKATVLEYGSPSGDIVIPAEIDGYPVTAIGTNAFEGCAALGSVRFPAGLVSISDFAFSDCDGLTNLWFEGNAPEIGENVFQKASSNCRIYVRYGSSGWGVDIPGRWGVGIFDPAEVADISGSGWYSYKVPASEDEFVFAFTNAGRSVSFTPKIDVSVKEVFVLGGGGGGGPGGGGGGGGESLWITNAVDYAADETGTSVYVGRGGSGGDVRYSGNAVMASSSSNGSTSYVMMKNPRNPSSRDQYQGYGGLRGGFFYRDNDSYSAGYGSYWGGSAGGGSALVTSGHHAGDSVMNAAGRTYGRADYASGFGGAAVDGAPGGGGGGGLRGIATGGGNYADEGARRSVVYAGSDGADGTGGISGGKGGDGFPISIMGDSPIRVAIGNLVDDQDAWLGGGGGGGSGRNRSGYTEMWGVGAESPGEGGRGGGGSGGLYTAGTFYNYQPGLGKNGAPFTGGGGGGGSFMEPVTNASSVASNWILGGGKGADGFVVMLVKVKSGGGNGWPIDYVHHDVTLDANGGVCSVGSVSIAEGPLSEALPTPTREDAAFLGWFTELEGGEKVGSSTMVLGETTFYAHWLFEVAEPQIVSEGGTEFYADSCTVTITCATPGASIYYTDDGTTPKINEHYLYSAPITITETTTLKAVAALDAARSAYATLTITKKALTLEDALDVGDGVSVDAESSFPWKPVLDADAKTGNSSARSAQIGDRASCWLSATVTGAGSLTFWCKTSCEHDEDDAFSWDRLMVYTNDVEITDWRMDGETDWMQRSVKFDGGVNTVKWVYFKDRTGADGEDCAWVDSIAWQPLSPDATVEIGGGKSVVVPGEWLSEHQEYLRAKASDVDVALKSTSANGRLAVVECYLLGLNPEKTDDDFKITSFPLKADGSPDLDAITFSPPQSKWNISGATPKLKGKVKLNDQWQDVPPGGNPSFRFFTIQVELP